MSILRVFTRHRIYSVLICLVMIFMTTGYNFSSYSIAALTLFFLVDKNLFTKIKRVNFKLYFPFLLYFLLLLIAMLYTDNQTAGWKLISLSVSILILPLIILSEEFSEKVIFKILTIYKFWLVVLALFLIFHKLFIAKGPLWTLTMFSLKTQIGIHQLYFSQFYFMGILIAFKQLFEGKTNPIWRWLEISFFVFFIVVLGSFTAVLLIIPMVFILIIKHISKKTLWLRIIFISVFVFGAIALSQTTIVKTKLLKLSTVELNFDKNLEKHEELKNSFGNVNTINLRIIKWYSAVNIIKNNLGAGVGTGDSTDELLKEYEALQFKNGLDFKYNAHNQYLESTIKFGFLGFVSVLFLLIKPLTIAKKNKDFVLLFISIFLIGAYSFESMLERQHGVVFLSFFIPLLYVFNKKQ